jgi:hypothetical protein
VIVPAEDYMKIAYIAIGFVTLGVVFTGLVGINEGPSLAYAQTIGVEVRGAEPVVPKRQLVNAAHVITSDGYVLKLDGLRCTACEINSGGILSYGGGSFELRDFHHTGSIEISLTGAAWNTYKLLFMLGLIKDSGNAPSQPPAQPHGGVRTISSN